MTDPLTELQQYRRAAREALEAAAAAEMEHDWRAVARLLMAASNHSLQANRAAVTLMGEASA